MESALCTLLSALVVLLCSSPECKGEDTVSQPAGDVLLTQGDTGKIECNYKTSDSYPYLFWYKQDGRGALEYLLRIVNTGTIDRSSKFNKAKFDAKLNKTSLSLIIQDVDVTDSAVYYCALQPTVTGNTKTLNKNLWSKDNTILQRSKANCQCEKLSRLQKVHMRITQLCFGHMFPLMAALLLLLLSGVRCEELTALKPEVCAEQGKQVSLEYEYYKEATLFDYFYWYRQYPGNPPEFLVSHYGIGGVIPENVTGLKLSVRGKSVSLLLSSAAVGDSAVYYCAVRPTVTANPQSLNKSCERKQQYSTRPLEGDTGAD
ncbi:hypothetical protein WMY93_032993 [Mugilogobius chulae]|uniref:Ig-like domain-containing protein n=1 Tax=Mugilogobius chulae TaxID=88201 RepID=A0AAW0MIA3_9GOBI